MKAVKTFLVSGFFLAGLSLASFTGAQPLCPNPTPVACGETKDGDNQTTPSNISKYSCDDFVTAPVGEVYYQITLSQMTALQLTVTPSAAEFDPLIAILPMVGVDCNPGACIALADTASSGEPESLSTELDAGTYFIVIDGWSTAGAFKLSVACEQCLDSDGDGYSAFNSTSCPSGNDCCDTGTEATFLGCSVEKRATIHPGAEDLCGDLTDSDCDGYDCRTSCLPPTAISCGETMNGNNGGAGSSPNFFDDEYACLNKSTLNGPEYGYSFSPGASNKIKVTVQAAGGFDPVLAVIADDGAGCVPDGCVVGSDSTSAGEAETVTFTAGAAAKYYLVVDGFGDSASNTGDFTISVVCESCVDADGDSYPVVDAVNCPSGSDCDDSNADVHPGIEEICSDGIDQDCSGGDQPCFCPDIDRDGFSAAGCGGDDCCDDGTEADSAGCSPAAAAVMNPAALEVCGDQIDNNCDGLDLSPCPLCAADMVLSCENPTGRKDTSTAGHNNINDYCGGEGAEKGGDWSGPEFIFSVTPTQDTGFKFSGDALDFFVLSDFGAPSVCNADACLTAAGRTYNSDTAVFFGEQGSTYFISVDGYKGASATFNYSLTCFEEESCLSGDLTLDCDSDPISGNNKDGANRINVYNRIPWGMPAPESIYSFTPTTDVLVSMTMVMTTTDLALIVVEDDGNRKCLPRNVVAWSDKLQSVQSIPEHVMFAAKGGKTYYVIADGWDNSAVGPFSLSLGCVVDCGPLFNCNEVCVDLERDPKHCGSCVTSCSDGEFCWLGKCLTGCPSVLTRCGDGCFDTSSDPAHCGTCGKVCSFSNAWAACKEKGCVFGGCNTGFADCDNDIDTGCETQLGTLTDCGSCKDACSFKNANTTCQDGKCVLDSCNPNFGDCNLTASDGCETSLRDDFLNCGGCGHACGAGGLCSNAACCEDADGDSFAAKSCGGTDCDDANPKFFPGAVEQCGDKIDQNCDGSDTSCPCPDGDLDGYPDLACDLGGDCNDADSSIHPGVVEICDNLDNNCDGRSDEGDICRKDSTGCGCSAFGEPVPSPGWLVLLALGLFWVRRRD